jgi:hypothetical protein
LWLSLRAAAINLDDHFTRRSSSLCEIRGRLPQDLVRPPQLEDLTLQILHPLASASDRVPALVALSLPDPPAERLHRAAQFSVTDRTAAHCEAPIAFSIQKTVPSKEPPEDPE